MPNLFELSLYIPYLGKRGSRLLPESVIATVVQMMNNFVQSNYKPAWDRGIKLSLKRADVYVFYQDCLIVFCVKCSIRILALLIANVSALVSVRNSLSW